MSQRKCHCGRDRPFADCCEPLITGGEVAAIAEDLMRSRYSAYVLMNADYLRETWHPQTRPSRVRMDPDLRWLGLKIKATEHGNESDSEGTVEFVARCKTRGRAERLHETSRFEKIAGRWFYRDGIHHKPK